MTSDTGVFPVRITRTPRSTVCIGHALGTIMDTQTFVWNFGARVLPTSVALPSVKDTAALSSLFFSLLGETPTFEDVPSLDNMTKCSHARRTYVTQHISTQQQTVV